MHRKLSERHESRIYLRPFQKDTTTHGPRLQLFKPSFTQSFRSKLNRKIRKGIDRKTTKINDESLREKSQ